MSDFFEVDPGSLQSAGRQVDEIFGAMSEVRRRAKDLESVPMRHHFPAMAAGQDAAQRWDEARATVTDGLDLLVRALGKLSAAMGHAGKGYQASDTQARVRSETVNRIELPL